MIAPEVAAWFRGHVDSLRLALAAETRAEAALVARVHDALRASDYDDARALLAPFVDTPEPLPDIEGEAARRTLALALVALDEQAGEIPSALARIEAVLSELGPEEEALARDLAATVALLARWLGGESAGGQGLGGTAQTLPGDLPADYALGQPYPNPFGGSGRSGATTVPFALPEAARVTVAVYDLLGRRVVVLAEGAYEAGRHVATLDGRGLASGVYLVRAVMDAVVGTGRPSGAAGTTRSFTRRVTLIR